MYQTYLKTISIVLIMVGLAGSIYGQMPIYSFSFDEGLEDWTPEGISSGIADSSTNALWVWAPEGNAGTGAFNNGTTPIGSASGGGALLFDSDGLDNGGSQTGFGLGPAPSPQRGEITSPALDFSGESRVLISFYQYYRYFAKDDGSAVDGTPTPATADFETPASSFEVSGDGGMTWTTFEINEDINPNESTRPTDIIVEDISDIAAGQADVRVRFVWDGEYYFWLIDDVQFFSERGADLAIVAFSNVNNFETPDILMAADTADLEVLITNQGDVDVEDSVMVWTRVLDNDLNLIYSDTGYIDGIGIGDTIFHDFNNWMPGDLPQNGDGEAYTLAYNVRIKGDTLGELVKPDDNIDFSRFIIRDFTVRKVPGGDGFGFSGQNPQGEFEDFAWGNLFNFPPSLNESFEVSRVTFDAFSTDSQNDPLVGKNVLVFIFELPYNSVDNTDTLLQVEIDGNIFLNNFPESPFTIDQMLSDGLAVGIGSYQFAPGDDGSPDPFTVEVVNFEDDLLPVTLSPGHQYFVVVQYQSSANTIAQEISRTYDMFQASTLSYYPSLGAGNSFLFLSTPSTNYAENVAAIGLELELSTAVDEIPLPETAVKIYPNPASDFIRVDLSFEEPTDATLFIADVNGKILVADNKQRVLTDQYTYDMNRFPSGNYIVRVSTSEGTKTEHIVVTH